MNKINLIILLITIVIQYAQAQNDIDAWVINTASHKLLVEQGEKNLNYQFLPPNVNGSHKKFWTIKDECKGYYFSSNLNSVIDHNQNHKKILDSLTTTERFSQANWGGLFKFPHKDSLFVVIGEDYRWNDTIFYKNQSTVNYAVFNAKTLTDTNANESVIMRQHALDTGIEKNVIVIPHSNNVDQWIINRQLNGLVNVWKFDSSGLDESFQSYNLSYSPDWASSGFYPSINGSHIFYELREYNKSILCIAKFDKKNGIFKEIKKIERSFFDPIVPNNRVLDMIFLDSVNILYLIPLGMTGIIEIQFDVDFNIIDSYVHIDPSHIYMGIQELIHTAMRLGKDGKIYVSAEPVTLNNQSIADSIRRHISVIDKPFLFGEEAGFRPLSFNLGNHILNDYAEKMAPSASGIDFNKSNISIEGTCLGDTLFLYPANKVCQEFQHWIITSPIGNEFSYTNPFPKIPLTDTGIYKIEMVTDMDTSIIRRYIRDTQNVVFIIDTSFCKGEEFGIGFINQNKDLVYTWQNGDHHSFMDIEAAGTYHLQVKGECHSEDYYFDVIEFENNLDLDKIKTEYCDYKPVAIELPDGNYKYNWLNDNEDMHFIESSGTYQIGIFNSCLDTIIDVFVNIDESNAINGINVFTPNGDGYNDLFKPYSENINPEGFSLTIYNRWGRKIFETSEPNEYWDGGQSVSGTYFYQLQYSDCFEAEKMYKGVVELLR